MKKTLFAIALGIIGLHSEAQNELSEQLQANKWFGDGSPKYTSCVYSKIPVKGQTKELRFLKNGKLIDCNADDTNSFREDGREVVTSGKLSCDSTGTYTIKKDKIHIIEQGSAHWYYRISSKNGSLVFSPIYSEDFNKD